MRSSTGDIRRRLDRLERSHGAARINTLADLVMYVAKQRKDPVELSPQLASAFAKFCESVRSVRKQMAGR